MAFDKLIDSAKLDAAITATAKAIRNKTGSSAKIAWNESTGFSSAISQIKGKLQSKTATPKATSQTIKPDSSYDGLSQVTVNGDANLKAENIAIGVSIFGVTGTLEGGTKVATGTFTGRGSYISNTPWVKITGLSFKPSRVVLFGENGYDHGVIFADSEGYTDGYAFCKASGYDEELDDYWDYLTTETSKFHLILNSDGFQVNTDGSGEYGSLWFPNSTTYHYIAIG